MLYAQVSDTTTAAAAAAAAATTTTTTTTTTTNNNNNNNNNNITIIFYIPGSKGSRGLKTKVKNVAGMAIGPGNDAEWVVQKHRVKTLDRHRDALDVVVCRRPKVADFLAQIADEIQCWSIDRPQVLRRNGLEDGGSREINVLRWLSGCCLISHQSHASGGSVCIWCGQRSGNCDVPDQKFPALQRDEGYYYYYS